METLYFNNHEQIVNENYVICMQMTIWIGVVMTRLFCGVETNLVDTWRGKGTMTGFHLILSQRCDRGKRTCTHGYLIGDKKSGQE